MNWSHRSSNGTHAVERIVSSFFFVFISRKGAVNSNSKSQAFHTARWSERYEDEQTDRQTDRQINTRWRQFFLLHFIVPQPSQGGCPCLPSQYQRYLNNFCRFHGNHHYSCIDKSRLCFYKARSCRRDSHLAHTHPHLLRGKTFTFIKELGICRIESNEISIWYLKLSSIRGTPVI